MKLFRSLLIALCCYFFSPGLKAQVSSVSRVKLNFNPGWKLYVGDAAGANAANFNEADWKNISLPHAWNEDDAFKKPIDSLSTGIAWYRKHFKVPAQYIGKKIFIEFEGLRQAGDV